MITVTFVRHGESEDNPREIWAGWKDAPLSELGKRQAQAVGASFSETRLDHIYASPLLRAFATAQAIHDAQPHPQPPLTSNPNLREQHFGIAEGHAWMLDPPPYESLQNLYDRNVFPVLKGRDASYTGGESLNELALRARRAITECIIPHIQEDNAHIAIASHGLCISELIAAVLCLDPTSQRNISYAGLLNTAWTRLTISVKDGHLGPIDPNNPPALDVRVTHVNQAGHLASVKPTAIDAEDKSQSDARIFFAGGHEPGVAAPPVDVEIVA